MGHSTLFCSGLAGQRGASSPGCSPLDPSLTTAQRISCTPTGENARAIIRRVPLVLQVGGLGFGHQDPSELAM